MKRIFCFLLVAIGFLSTERVVAQDNCDVVDGQVRYAFELKTLTKTEADDAQAQGYVDLWTYMCFDEAFVQKGAITVTDGKISYFGLLSALNTHSYKMVDKNGNEDRTGSVAMFAKPTASQSCSGRPNISQTGITESGAIGATFIQGTCPTWAYGSSSETSGAYSGVLAEYYCTTLEAEGKTWYCLKMYKVRFEYKQASSFYVTFYKGDAADGTTSNGASTFNARIGNTTTNLIWPGKTCGVGGQDWSDNYGKNNRYGFIPGGVEVIADPDMELTAEAACGGSDVTGNLNVNDWAGKDWSNYGSVKFYVNATGGNVSSRKPLALGSDITATVPTSGTAAPIAYALTPAGYTLSNGSYADSLIWVIEDTFLA